jgi:hypothetical protein
MRNAAKWSIWNKFYIADPLLCSGLLFFVSLTVFVSALRQGSQLKTSDFIIQTLMTFFLPLLVIGL